MRLIWLEVTIYVSHVASDFRKKPDTSEMFSLRVKSGLMTEKGVTTTITLLLKHSGQFTSNEEIYLLCVLPISINLSSSSHFPCVLQLTEWGKSLCHILATHLCFPLKGALVIFSLRGRGLANALMREQKLGGGGKICT